MEKCLKCRWRWERKKPRTPKSRCPNCFNPNYDIPYVNKRRVPGEGITRLALPDGSLSGKTGTDSGSPPGNAQPHRKPASITLDAPI